jgi:hypothetical protein
MPCHAPDLSCESQSASKQAAASSSTQLYPSPPDPGTPNVPPLPFPSASLPLLAAWLSSLSIHLASLISPLPPSHADPSFQLGLGQSVNGSLTADLAPPSQQTKPRPRPSKNHAPPRCPPSTPPFSILHHNKILHLHQQIIHSQLSRINSKYVHQDVGHQAPSHTYHC